MHTVRRNPEQSGHRALNWAASRVVVALFLLGVILTVVYGVASQDQNLLSTLVSEFFGLVAGVGLTYLIVDARFEAERRARLLPVERDVLMGVYSFSMASVRVIAIYMGNADQDPANGQSAVEPDEAERQRRLELWARRFVQQADDPPDVGEQAMGMFRARMAGIFDDVHRYQQECPYVFVEHPEIARAVVRLRPGLTEVEAAAYDVLSAGSAHREVQLHQYVRALQQCVGRAVDICDLCVPALRRLEQP